MSKAVNFTHKNDVKKIRKKNKPFQVQAAPTQTFLHFQQQIKTKISNFSNMK